MQGILDGVRVLDFGRYVAGPWCAGLLADLGADVIRVERVGGGEDRLVAPMAPGDAGAIFLQVNRGKRGITLDTSRAEGQEIVRRLLGTADVVVANVPPRARRSMGLDWETVHATNRRTILVTATTFGTGGPYSDRVGFDGIAQVMSSSAYLSGVPGQPTKSYVAWVDYGTAGLLAFSTLAALMQRQLTGEGQHVDGALLKTALTVSDRDLIEQAVNTPNRVATLNRGQTSGPYDVFATKDGHIIVMVIGQFQFERWCKLMGEDHWLHDQRFCDDQSRGDNGAVLSERMSRWCADRTTDAAIAELEAAGLPVGPVYSPQQALDDPHVRAIGFLRPMEYPGVPGPSPVTDFPVAMSATPAFARGRAPLLGEHTDAVLAEIGYGPDEIAVLHERGIV